jgi:phosphoribosylformimino-5-aminoimidazole carboxamide ribotide isomerase
VILYPAIDLKDGRCVRLARGEMASATVFNDDPADQARRFAAAGFAWLHLVDLDGAVAGRAVNGNAVEGVLAATSLPVQLGGGVRDMAAIEAWLGRGVRRVVLGTAAFADPDLVRAACRRFPARIAVALDSRQGEVAVEGWAKGSGLTAIEVGRRFADVGVAALLFTDIDRDGMLAGVNVEATAELARTVGVPVIASGGVAGLDDLVRLKTVEADGVAGVVVGRALYDGRLDPVAALALLRGEQ